MVFSVAVTVILDDRALFTEGHLYEYLEQRKASAVAEVGRYDGNQLLVTPFDDVVSVLVEKFRVEPLQFDEASITTEQEEAQVETSRIPDGRWRYGGHQSAVAATRFRFYVPFHGDDVLFRLLPSSYTTNPPRGTISGTDLIITFMMQSPDPEALQAQFRNQFGGIKQWVQNQSGLVEGFNLQLPNLLGEKLRVRKEQLLKAANTVAAIGFPLRKRSGMPVTFAAPKVRRKIRVENRQLPAPANTPPFRPEPVLEDRDYEHIIEVMENMALVLERSPSAFETMGEEGLRQHFLVQLNGHYEGTATAETFNVSGKTDILIRSEGRNIFIAECKFWRGPAGFTETIDQLLGYTSWRDTKTAIVLFNRDTQMTTVLEKVPEQLRSHQNYKRAIDTGKETRFRAVLSHRDDPTRELLLTVLVFDVPG